MTVHSVVLKIELFKHDRALWSNGAEYDLHTLICFDIISFSIGGNDESF
jgi:hypothetical protein